MTIIQSNNFFFLTCIGFNATVDSPEGVLIGLQWWDIAVKANVCCECQHYSSTVLWLLQLSVVWEAWAGDRWAWRRCSVTWTKRERPTWSSTSSWTRPATESSRRASSSPSPCWKVETPPSRWVAQPACAHSRQRWQKYLHYCTLVKAKVWVLVQNKILW